MSAFLCSDAHVGALVRYWLDHDRYGRFREIPLDQIVNQWRDVYASLVTENERSLRARYTDADQMFGLDVAPVPAKPHVSSYRTLTAVEAIKAAQCFEYPACEHDGWEKSEAAAIIRQIINTAIHHLDGYAAAPWGLE